MRVKVYHGLDDLPDGYNQLFDQVGAVSFFHSRAWFRTLIDETTNTGDSLRLYGLEAENATASPMALLVTRSYTSQFGPIRQRVLETFTNFYTMRGGPILSTDITDIERVINTIVAEIASDRPRWDVVLMRQLDPDSIVFQSLIDAFRKAGMSVQQFRQNIYWQEVLTGRSFDEYISDRGTAIRKKLRWKDRKLSKSDRFVYALVSDETGLEAAISDYQKIYQASWKEPEAYPDFIPRLIRECGQLGTLRLGLMYFDGEPIATQLTFLSGQTAFQYKMAYDQKVIADSYTKNLSIGAIMILRLVKHLIEVDQIDVLDVGVGDESFKSEWCTERSELWSLMASNRRTAPGLLSASRHVAGPVLSSAWKKTIGR